MSPITRQNLPATSASPQSGAPAGNSQAQGLLRSDRNDRPVLIVDDDVDAHFLLKRQLARIGLATSIECVSDGRDAVSMFERCMRGEQPFPLLVFLDIKMPMMTGFEVLQWMGDRQLLGSTCVVILSSSDDGHDVSRAMALGAHSYLTKPAPDRVLTELVNNAVRLGTRRADLSAQSRRKVLVADDSPFARRTTRRMFEVMGYEVFEAEGSAEAVARFRELEPDFVFLDVMMGGPADGIAALKDIKALSPEAKVIIATADVQTPTGEAARAAGALAVINKPLTIEKVGAVLKLV